jgi:hypothetical protein
MPWSAALRLGAEMRQRKTDYGTVFLHRLTMIALSVAFFTGLHIGTKTYERVWTAHMQAAVVLLAISPVKSGTTGMSGQSILKWNEVA